MRVEGPVKSGQLIGPKGDGSGRGIAKEKLSNGPVVGFALAGKDEECASRRWKSRGGNLAAAVMCSSERMSGFECNITSFHLLCRVCRPEASLLVNQTR